MESLVCQILLGIDIAWFLGIHRRIKVWAQQDSSAES